MKRKHHPWLVLLAVLAVAATFLDAGSSAASSPARRVSSAQFYEPTNLGTLGGRFSQAFGINNFGQVVGYSEVEDGEYHAFLWQDGEMTDLGTLPGDNRSLARDINDLGEAVGYSEIIGGRYTHAVLWRDGVAIDLGGLPAGWDEALAINNSGQVGGYAELDGGDEYRAVVWQLGQPIRNIHPSWAPNSVARGLNDAGGVVGGGNRRALFWQDGVLSDIGTLGGEFGQAFDLNNVGQIVGDSSTASAASHAFLWRDGVMSDLGTLGGDSSRALAINDAGQVVGYSKDLSGTHRPFLWWAGEMTDLGTLGGAIGQARAINEAGQVVGYSHTASGPAWATLWQTPLHSLLTAVAALVTDDTLEKKYGNSLTRRLRAALKALDNGQLGSAYKRTLSFTKRVRKLVNKGQLTQDQGDPLIAAGLDMCERLDQ